QVGLEVIAEGALNRLDFIQAQQAIIDEDACDLRTDCLDEEGRRNRGIDAAGQAADDAVLADAPANVGDSLLDERFELPLAGAAANVVKEVVQNLVAERRV